MPVANQNKNEKKHGDNQQAAGLSRVGGMVVPTRIVSWILAGIRFANSGFEELTLFMSAPGVRALAGACAVTRIL